MATVKMATISHKHLAYTPIIGGHLQSNNNVQHCEMATISLKHLASTPVASTPVRGHLQSNTSLPTPFFKENDSFNKKRNRKECEVTPEPIYPFKPRPRMQSISRCFKKSLFNGPKVVGGLDETSFRATPGYSDKAKQTFLEQCFKITKIIGEGSFGRVYKCTDKLSGIEYAVKISEGYNAMSVQEVRKHEALSVHPNCVKFYKAWEERRALHIQMELCDESLGNFVRRIDNKLNECEVWRILQHTLSGLEHFHNNGLRHMDVKPDNIFRCTAKNTIVYKLGDFGLAITSNDFNKSDLIEGDSKYLARELLDGRCDDKADIFSIGISILELIAKIELPNNGVMWQSLRNGELPPTAGFSSSLRCIVAEMMNKDPDKRPSATTLLNNPNHKYYSWLNYIKDKGSSLVNSFWPSWLKRQDFETQGQAREDVLEGMTELEDDIIDIKEPALTPILLKKKLYESPQQPFNRKSFSHTTPVQVGSPRQSPQVWPGSPLLSPVHSVRSNQSLLCMSNILESSTPRKTFAFDESELEELDEGEMFERPSLIKRNLLDSFDYDHPDIDHDVDESF